MSKVTADYPDQVWDGLSGNRTNRVDDKAPDHRDWDQMTAEVIASQEALDDANAEQASSDDLTVPNGSGGALVVGASVYMLANGTGAQKADCNGTAPARNVCGLVSVGAGGAGGNVTVKQRGRLTLTTTEWDAVTGDSGGLVPFTEYYLSATAGLITKTAPATTGDNVVVVGIAESATVMNLNIRHSRISA